MQKGKIELTQKDAENTPAGGVVVGKRDGQTMIYDDASLGGYFVGKLHSEGGIKMINKSTGQPLEVQGSEVIITAPAVYDKTKRNFEGKMMTNREILSKINSDGGGVSFANGGDIPAKIHTADKEYEYGGKMVHDSDIANSLGMNSTLKKGKQHFSSGGKTYDVDAIYNAVKKNKLHLKTKEVPTFAMKYPVYDKQYSETVKTDFRKPNGITVRTESGEEVLIDGNHRMNNAYLKGKKTMKTYYIEDPKQIAKFTKNSKFELGGENKMSKKEKQEIIDSINKFWESNDTYKLSSDALYVLRKDNNLNPPKYKRYQNFEDFYSDIKTRERNSIERENAKKVFEYLEGNGAELQHKSIYGSRYYFYKGENIRVSDHWQTSEIKDSETGLNKYRDLPSFYSDEKDGWKKMITKIENFVNGETFELGGENNDFQKLVEEKFSEGYGKVKHFELNSSGGSWSYINNPNVTRSQRDKMPVYTFEVTNDLKDKATEIKKNYEINQSKEISILQFAEKFAKDNNGKIYHKSKSGSVYVRVKDKEIRISDHNILERDSMNPKNRYDLEIIQRYFDEKTPSNLDYWIDEFENGGQFDSKLFLDYYFEEIKDFLKNQNDINLKDDFTFFHRGENFKIEPLILVNNQKEESIQKAIFTIIDQDDEEVGEIKFDANSKQNKKFEAYSDFFEWNNINFDEGGSVSKENEFVFEEKSDRLKSFYKTNNPSIDKLLIDCQPFIAELIDKQKELVLKQSMKELGFYKPMTELDVEYYEIGLLFKMVQSFNKYLKVTDVLTDAKIQKHSDLFEISATVTRDGRKYSFYTELIPAGGYNIQEFHYRYITKTDLPESGENSAVENLKSKNTTLNKIKSIDLDIQRISQAIARDEEKLKKGFEILNGREYVLKQDSINRYKSYIKDFYKDIEKLKTKKTDLESVFGSLEKKGVGVNFGKEVKEVIGRKLLVDRLRASKYKETGDYLEFKIEIRSIQGEKISENSYSTLGQINTFTFTDEGNGLCSIKAGLELRGKYTLCAEFKNVPIRDIRLKINEIFKGEFEKYLKDGGDLKSHHKSGEDLVKDAKDGNTPARDLNNYNDLLDVQADGEVGGNSGVFADGGETNKIDESDLSDLLEMVQSSKYADGGKLGNEPKEGDLITNFGKYGVSIFDVDDNYVYWLDQYASKQYCKKSDLTLNNLDDDGEEDGYCEDERNDWICNKVYANGGLSPYDANSDGDSASVFDTGGTVGLPKVAYVKVTNAGASLSNLIGNEYNSYIEFAESVEYAYKQLGKTVRSYLSLTAFDESSKKLIEANTYVSNQKNTVKNFNPFTGNYKNLEKSLANSRPRSFQNFDWQDWFLSRVKPSTASSKTTTQPTVSLTDLKGTKILINNDKDLAEKVIKKAEEFGFKNNSAIKDLLKYEKIYALYFNQETYIGWLDEGNFRENSFREITVDDLFGTKTPMSSQAPASTSNQALDLSDTKVWTGDDEGLSKAIQEVAFGLGWTWSGDKNFKYTDSSALFFEKDKIISSSYNRSTFDNEKKYKEINPQDILLAKKPTITTTQAPASTSVKPFDFTDTKIDVSNRPDFRLKVQKRAFELGWEWENKGGKTLDYDDFNYLYFTKTSISSGNTSTSFVNSPKREITEADIFGSQINNSVSNKDNSVDVVRLDYELDGKSYSEFFRKAESLLKDFSKIEDYCIRNPDDIVSVYITAEVVELTGKIISKKERISFGENAFKRRNFSNDRIKKLIEEEWFDNKLDFNEFFKDVTLSSKKDVQSVLVTYAGGQTYTALNEERLLDKIVELWKDGGRSTMSIDLQPQGYIIGLSQPLTILLDTIRTSKTSVQPSSLINSELREYLSKDWYPELDWSDFFKEAKNTTSNSVNSDGKISKFKIETKGTKFSDVEVDNIGLLFFILKERKDYDAVILFKYETPKGGQKEFGAYFRQNPSEYYFLRKDNFNIEYLKEKLNEWFPNLISDSFFGAKNTIQPKALLTDLSKTKIQIIDSEMSKKVQERAFELGWYWTGDRGQKKQQTITPKYLFFYEDKEITRTDIVSFFEDSDFKEIFADDLFENSKSTQTATSKRAVPKTTEKSISNLDEAVKVLEKASAKVAVEYNKEVYEQSLKFLYDTKASYELALKFTPESAFMYERLDMLRKLADIEKSIKKIEDMKKGGAFFMLAKILEKLERGENWKLMEQTEDVITNQLPQSEIDVIIRSQKFKNWFGNWEKAVANDEYDNVSKALTNGLPSVYHHGARRIKYTYREVSNGVLYLAENISYALWFSQNATAQSEEGNYLTECFVNIKNPIDLTAFRVKEIDFGDLIKYIDAIYPLANIYDFVGNQVALLVKTNQPTNIRMRAWQLIRSYAKFVNHIKENTPYDGFLYYENNPSDQVVNPTTGQVEENVTKAVAIFKSHQVKVVDAVIFDGGLDDWRFENGGKLNN